MFGGCFGEHIALRRRLEVTDSTDAMYHTETLLDIASYKALTAFFFVASYLLRLRLRLGFAHPLQDVALHQCLPLSSVCCLPNPGGFLLLCYVVLPCSAWSSS